jgi:hypothetical protein
MTNPATMRSGKIEFARDAYTTKGKQTLGISQISKLSLPFGSAVSKMFGFNVVSDEITYKFDPVLQDLLPDTTIELKSGDVDARLMLGGMAHSLKGVTKLSSIPGIMEAQNLKEVTLIVKLTSSSISSANSNFSMTWTASLPDVIRGSLVVAPPILNPILNFFGLSSTIYTPPLIIYSPSEVRGVLPCTLAGASFAAWQYACPLSGRMMSQLNTTTFRATMSQGGELYLQVSRILSTDRIQLLIYMI